MKVAYCLSPMKKKQPSTIHTDIYVYLVCKDIVFLEIDIADESKHNTPKAENTEAQNIVPIKYTQW